MLILKKLLGCLLSKLGGEFMIQFCGGLISGQTGDMLKKPETENGGCPEIPENRKNEGIRKSKIEIIDFPCGS